MNLPQRNTLPQGKKVSGDFKRSGYTGFKGDSETVSVTCEGYTKLNLGQTLIDDQYSKE